VDIRLVARARSIFAAIVSFAVVMGGALAFSPPAQAAYTASISGSVTLPAGADARYVFTSKWTKRIAA
jgi:hypothetical protein